MHGLLIVCLLLGGLSTCGLYPDVLRGAEPSASGQSSAADEAPEVSEGVVNYVPPAKEEIVPSHLHLDPHTFPYREKPTKNYLSKMETSLVTFPSPVKTPHENNNTVHCEYFRPAAEGKYPAVVVLHILGGDFELSRLFCKQMVLNDVAALFVKLPYYGPRKQPGVDIEMVSGDPEQTVKGFTQGVLDIRRAAAWLGSREEVDEDQLGIMGISLGGITGSLALTAEPRFKKGFLMLAGGDVGRIGWESPLVSEMREKWVAAGRTREELVDLLKPVDPVTYGKNVHDRKIWMLNATHDEIIPRACTDSLWEAFGKPEITWVDAGHYSAMRFLVGALERSGKFFKTP
jgi:hypothetical protein